MNGYSSAASASTGQSFYSPSGNSWRDLTAYNSTANFCCKAYTQSSSAVVALSSMKRHIDLFHYRHETGRT